MNHGCSPYKRNARAIRVFDRNPNWCANRRYRDHIMVLQRRLKRPFGSLVEMGVIKPGTEIYDQKKKINAKILVDGSIKYQKSEG